MTECAAFHPARAMRKYLLPGLLVLILALNVAGYLFVVLELDGSKVVTKRSLVQPERAR
jgi:hypothetical protein